MSWHKEAKEIEQRRELSKGQGGAESIAKHHAKGRLTIRERIDALRAMVPLKAQPEDND